MNKVSFDPRLPIVNDEKLRPLNTRLYEILNKVAISQNQFYEKLSDFVSVKDYGALGDGVADDTAAIKNSIIAAKTGGGVVFFPKGKYRVTTGGITIDGVSLVGCGTPEFGNTYDDNSSVILLDSTTVTPFTLGLGWRISGLTFYYPNQDGTSATPIVYPPTFTGTYVAGGLMENCSVINSYDVFKFTSGTAIGDLRFSVCRIYGINTVFWFLQGATEVINVSDCIFSHGVFTASYTPQTYLRDHNSSAGTFCLIDVGSSSHTSVDGFDMSNSIVYGYRYGIRVISGSINVSTINNNWFDAVRTALSIEAPGTIFNTKWTDNYHWSQRPGFSAGNSGSYGYNTTDNTINISASGGGSNLFISGNDFVYSMGHHIWWNALSFVDVKITDNRFYAWGQDAVSSPTTYYAIGATDEALNGTIGLNKFLASSGVVSHARTAIAIGNAADINIVGNEFDDCYLSIHLIYAAIATIIGNTSKNSGFSAAVLNASSTGVLWASSNKWDKPVSGPSGVPKFSATHGDQTFPAAKTQALFTLSEPFDTDTNFSSSTFTAPIAGEYEFDVQLANGTGVTVGDVWALSIERNGAATEISISGAYVPVAQAYSATLKCSARFSMAAGDTVKAYVTRMSGSGSYTTVNEGMANRFTGQRMSV